MSACAVAARALGVCLARVPGRRGASTWELPVPSTRWRSCATSARSCRYRRCRPSLLAGVSRAVTGSVSRLVRAVDARCPMGRPSRSRDPAWTARAACGPRGAVRSVDAPGRLTERAPAVLASTDFGPASRRHSCQPAGCRMSTVAGAPGQLPTCPAGRCGGSRSRRCRGGYGRRGGGGPTSRTSHDLRRSPPPRRSVTGRHRDRHRRARLPVRHERRIGTWDGQWWERPLRHQRCLIPGHGRQAGS